MPPQGIRKFSILVSVSTVLMSAGLLLTGSSLLVLNLSPNGDFPFGTLSTWAGIIALPIAVLLGCQGLQQPDDPLSMAANYLLKASVLLGLLWGFIARVFATNWAINFRPGDTFLGSPEAAVYFWAFTGVLTGLPLLVLVAYGMLRVFRSLRTPGQ